MLAHVLVIVIVVESAIRISKKEADQGMKRAFSGGNFCRFGAVSSNNWLGSRQTRVNNLTINEKNRITVHAGAVPDREDWAEGREMLVQ